MNKRELALTIADHGGWEEFHQKRHNYYMYDYHKNRRLELEAEYRKLSNSRMNSLHMTLGNNKSLD